jgi:hypothetical protein
MTVDQSVTPFAPDSGEVLSRFGFLSAEDLTRLSTASLTITPKPCRVR